MTIVPIQGVMTTPENAGWLRMFEDGDAYCVSSDIIRAINAASDDLRISVNTPGGDIDALNAIVAALTDWAIGHPDNRLEIRVQALAASCGAALLVFAPRMNTAITAHRTSRFMFHGAMASLGWAGADNCRDIADQLTRYNDELKAALMARTKVPPALLNTWFAASREGWLSAREALAYGIIDRIIEAEDVQPAPKISNLTLQKLKGFVNMPKLRNEEPDKNPEKLQPEAATAKDPQIPEDPDFKALDPEPEKEPEKEPEEKPDEELANLRKQLDNLTSQVASLQNQLAKAQAANRKLSPGFRAASSDAAQKPQDFHAALANLRQAHPGMSYDDAFCMTARKHPDLYNSLRNHP